MADIEMLVFSTIASTKSAEIADTVARRFRRSVIMVDHHVDGTGLRNQSSRQSEDREGWLFSGCNVHNRRDKFVDVTEALRLA